VRRIVEPPPLLLVRDGRLMHRNLRHERISPDELKEEMRKHGLDDWSFAKRAYMESDGQISVIPMEPGKHEKPPAKPVF
jgi:uncharacterized membrane protein YcaP (DUF421 family)